MILLFVILVLIIVTFISGIFIVPQGSEYVVERLGKFKCVATAGLNFKIPYIDRVVNRTTTKEQVLDSPPQPVITKDNATVQVDAVTYFSVFDSTKYTYGVVDPIIALSNLSATTLRNVIGEMTIQESLTSRDAINAKITTILDEATDKWGIKVTRVELKNIIPPTEIRTAMEKELKAERDKRQQILEAEAHKEAAITRAQGDKEAAILAAEAEKEAEIARAQGHATAVELEKAAEAKGIQMLKEAAADKNVLALKQYEALIALADGQASKIIIPTDVTKAVTDGVIFNETTGIGDVTHNGTKPLKLSKTSDPCCDDKMI